MIGDVCVGNKRRRFFRSSVCRQWAMLVVVDVTSSVPDVKSCKEWVSEDLIVFFLMAMPDAA